MSVAPMLVGAAIVLAVYSLLGAVALKATIGLLNQLLPTTTTQPPASSEPGADSTPAPVAYQSSDSTNPFSAPATAGYDASVPETRVMRDPSFAHAFGIMSVVAFCTMVANFLINFSMWTSGNPSVISVASIIFPGSLVGTVAHILMPAAILKLMLPTTFRKALLVVLIIGACIVLVVVVIMRFIG